MSVTDRESGVVADHITRLEHACRTLNVFLFIRPTEYDSTKLIQQGYATKSMSVHDKSSNWGPMAGFVPCDQFFSKKFIGQPNPNPVYSDHGPAKVVHLRLTDELVNKHDKMVEKKGNQPTPRIFHAPQSGNPAAEKIEFLLERQSNGWDVFWMSGSKKIPLYVWGYVTGGRKNPVTGDYDLWMVAPHMSWWKLHLQVVGVQDEHGSSCATLLNTWLLNKLNEACQRTDNPVFNHGAEAQNYGFTQALDSRLAMFTPAGGSRMVDRSDMPQILADLQSAAYLIYWNKRYGEADPHLSGKPYEMGVIPMVNELGKLLDKVGKPGGAGVLKHLARKDQRLRDILDIREFYNKLKNITENIDKRTDPKFLQVGEQKDLPTDFKSKLGTDTLEAQRKLQKAVITSSIGGGESNLDTLESWIDDNIEDVYKLCEAYGAVPGASTMGPESGFLLEKIQGTSFFRRV